MQSISTFLNLNFHDDRLSLVTVGHSNYYSLRSIARNTATTFLAEAKLEALRVTFSVTLSLRHSVTHSPMLTEMLLRQKCYIVYDELAL